MINQQLLDSYLGVGIEDICDQGYDHSDGNHCAHFVSHALGFEFGMTCKRLQGSKSGSAANVRVHEIFDQCPLVEEIIQSPDPRTGLIFVSKHSSFEKKGERARLRNVRKKHIGILFNGHVWHYSNTRDKVIKQVMSQFIHHYSGQRNSLWYGSVPQAMCVSSHSGLTPSRANTKSKDAKLTENFSLAEFHCKDGSQVPGEYMDNVKELAKNLQVLRDELKKPIKVNSGYRSPKHNRKVGGASRSHHLFARAADIRIKNISPGRIKAAIERLIKEEKMKQGGVGLYNTFVHYDIRGTRSRW